MAQNRMAAALKEWQKRADREKEFQRLSSAQADRIDQVPVVGRVSANVEPKYSLGDRIHDLSVGIGRGLGEQAVDTLNMIAHPVQTARTLYDAARSAITNPSATARQMADALRKDYGQITSGNMYDAGETLGKYLSLRPKPRNVATSELDVYHGTPHRFEPTEANPLGEFDASKIGTGEGAQSYGHGIYVAESPGVAKSYAETLGDAPVPRLQIDPTLSEKAYVFAENALKNSSYDSAKAAANLYKNKQLMQSKESIAAATEAINALKYGRAKAIDPENFNRGILYKADLPDEMIDRMLDWDKPLSEQPAVLAAIKNLPEVKTLMERGQKFENLTGQNFYKLISDSRSHGYRDASSGFKSAGIPGIKYLDAGSRGQDGSGTRNFVVFPGEEKKVKILERK